VVLNDLSTAMTTVAEGQKVMADALLPVLKKMLRSRIAAMSDMVN
jgi:hypothetical protein